MNRVVVTVEGGVVQSVCTDDPNLKVLVVDYDTDGDDKYLKKDLADNKCNMFRNEFINVQDVNEIFENYEKQGGVLTTDLEDFVEWTKKQGIDRGDLQNLVLALFTDGVILSTMDETEEHTMDETLLFLFDQYGDMEKLKKEIMSFFCIKKEKN